jgi:hypothetical protein
MIETTEPCCIGVFFLRNGNMRVLVVVLMLGPYPIVVLEIKIPIGSYIIMSANMRATLTVFIISDVVCFLKLWGHGGHDTASANRRSPRGI